MSGHSPRYTYAAKSRPELKAIADKILKIFPQRRIGYATDIEGIIEDLKFDIIYRLMPGVPVEAYVAKNPRIIVVNQNRMHYLPRYRFTLAEELAHRILEHKLWDNPKQLPDGARVHEFGSAQYNIIERDAKSLAAEILQPEEHYRERFAHHYEAFKQAGAARILKSTIREVAREFEVSDMSAAFRALVLKLIDRKTYNAEFPPLL